MENKFKVGDIVKGISDQYCYTNYDMTKGKVITVYDEENIEVEILEHKTEKGRIGNRYDVASKHFERINITKDDLKAGDIVTYRNGDKRTFNGTKIVYSDDYEQTSLSMSNFRDDLTDIAGDTEFDIVKVERPNSYVTVYTRQEEAKKMTVAQICEELGYDVEIIKEEN